MGTMKYFMLMMLLAIMIAPAKAGDPVWLKNMEAPRVEQKQLEASVIPAFPNAPAAAPAAFDKCRKYKGKQVAGYVLIPVSLGMMGGGAYLIYKGAKNIVDKTEVGFEGVSTDVSKEDKTMIGVGAALGFVGAVLFPTGLVMGIKGGTAYNRDCRGGGSSLIIRPTGTGVNMALKF